MLSEVPDYSRLPQSQITLKGLRAHYVDAGSGPSIVLVHGSPLSSFSFRHQIAALSSRFRVVAPDLLGFGQSDAPQEGATFSEQAELLRSLLDYLDLGPFRLLVHDWGGPVGIASVADRIEQVRQLVLVNTTVRSDFKPPIYWLPFTAPYISDFLLVKLNVFSWGLPVMMRAARESSVRRQYASSLKAVGTRKTMLRLERLEGYLNLAQEVEKTVRALRVPTLILWGLPDAYFSRAELEQLKKMFPAASVKEIPHGSHFPQEDAAETVTEELLRFFD